MNSYNRVSAMLGILAIALFAGAQPVAAAPWGECCDDGVCEVLDWDEMCIEGTPYQGEYCSNTYACCFPNGTCQDMFPSCCLDDGGWLRVDHNCDDPMFRCPAQYIDEQMNPEEVTPIENESSPIGGWSILAVGLLLLTVVPLVAARRRVRT